MRKMNLAIRRSIIALGVLALASGCSTLSNLNPFKKEDKFAPAKLEEVKSGVPARIVWKHSVGKAGRSVLVLARHCCLPLAASRRSMLPSASNSGAPGPRPT
jgi:outer membrane protein assembly factor BamB